MKVISVILVVLALVIGIVPQFTDCQSQGRSIALPNGKTVPMKCHWTGMAEVAVAIPIAVIGAALWFVKRKETRLMLGILGIVLGALAILLPTALIGVCSSAMLCNLAMSPTLILSGALVILVSLVTLVLALRKAEPVQ